jgi:hypothetical protein
MAEKNDILGFRIGRAFIHDVKLIATKTPDERARFAMSIIDRWALICSTPDGEDSHGRQKLKLTPETEVVDRAFRLAALAWQEMEKRGWAIDIPESAYDEAEKKSY